MTKYTKGFTLLELMVAVAIIGLLVAIAVPNFMKFQAMSKTAEVKANLKTIYTTENSFFAETETFSNRVAVIGFEPERGNRYAYYVDGTISCEDRTTSVATEKTTTSCISVDLFQYPGTASSHPTWAVEPLVVVGNTGSFTAAAAGQIAATLVTQPVPFDAWSISSVTRSAAVSSDATTSCAAGNNPGGEPCNDVNGV